MNPPVAAAGGHWRTRSAGSGPAGDPIHRRLDSQEQLRRPLRFIQDNRSVQTLDKPLRIVPCGGQHAGIVQSEVSGRISVPSQRARVLLPVCRAPCNVDFQRSSRRFRVTLLGSPYLPENKTEFPPTPKTPTTVVLASSRVETKTDSLAIRRKAFSPVRLPIFDNQSPSAEGVAPNIKNTERTRMFAGIAIPANEGYRVFMQRDATQRCIF